MNTISILDAFGNAPPRSPCVLCVPNPLGGTDMILTEWFSWLNIKRNPMLSLAGICGKGSPSCWPSHRRIWRAATSRACV